MNDISEIVNLISETPGSQNDLARVRTAIHRSSDPERMAGPRTHGSQIFLGDQPVGLFDAVASADADIHTRNELTYLMFPMNPKCEATVNAVPSYLLPRTTKVEVGISPKGTPQAVADDKVLGFMEPSGEICVILGGRDKFITWFPTAVDEEPWEMTALNTIEDHMHLAKAGRKYRVSELESYLGGSFDVVRKSEVFRQER
jgi:hypothetical protein